VCRFAWPFFKKPGPLRVAIAVPFAEMLASDLIISDHERRCAVVHTDANVTDSWLTAVRQPAGAPHPGGREKPAVQLCGEELPGAGCGAHGLCAPPLVLQGTLWQLLSLQPQVTRSLYVTVSSRNRAWSHAMKRRWKVMCQLFLIAQCQCQGSKLPQLVSHWPSKTPSVTRNSYGRCSLPVL